jgi:LysR family transcriptional regulator, benzoate and cis,cis-muconate-responsive activator of ben and cat genes
MELRHLRYFVTAAEELNFSRAAARLRVSQPPLSRQIKNLEDEIGALLFDRGKRRLQLTPAGDLFLREAKEILGQSERAVRLTRAVGQGKSGDLAIGFLSPLGGIFIPPALRRLLQRYPLVDVSVVEMAPRKQVDALLAHRIDLGIVPAIEARFEKELALEPVVKVALLAALPPAHRLTALRKVPLRELANEPLVVFKRSSAPALHDWIRDLCRARGFEPKIGRQCDQAQAILDTVASGIGASIVPAPFQRYRCEVAFRPLAPTLPKAELCMVWRRGDSSEVLGALRAILQQTFKEQSALFAGLRS